MVQTMSNSEQKVQECPSNSLRSVSGQTATLLLSKEQKDERSVATKMIVAIQPDPKNYFPFSASINFSITK
jgi:hypothetical protein